MNSEHVGIETVFDDEGSVGYREERTFASEDFVPEHICAYLTDPHFDAAAFIATTTLDSPEP